MIKYTIGKLKWWWYIKKWKLFGKRYCPYCSSIMLNNTYHIYYGTSHIHHYCFNCLKAILEVTNAFLSPSSEYDLLEYSSYTEMSKKYLKPEHYKIEQRKYIINKLLHNGKNNRDKKNNV